MLRALLVVMCWICCSAALFAFDRVLLLSEFAGWFDSTYFPAIRLLANPTSTAWGKGDDDGRGVGRAVWKECIGLSPWMWCCCCSSPSPCRANSGIQPWIPLVYFKLCKVSPSEALPLRQWLPEFDMCLDDDRLPCEDKQECWGSYHQLCSRSNTVTVSWTYMLPGWRLEWMDADQPLPDTYILSPIEQWLDLALNVEEQQ